MLIKNKKNLSITKERKVLLKLIEDGIEAAHPKNLLNKNLCFQQKNLLKIKNKTYKLKGRLFVIGAGKSSGAMAQELEKIIPPKLIQTGIISCPNIEHKTKKIKIIQASHPLPNKNSVKSAQKILVLKKKYDINNNDLIICLLSGGGSALLSCPAKPLSLKDLKTTNKLLINSGANIKEINIVRKHISKIKGGWLAQHFYPTQIISLIISDVAEGDLSSVASGPTAADKSTFEDAYKIIKKYRLADKIPPAVLSYIKKGLKKKKKETPKKLTNCHNVLIGSNKNSLKTIKKGAQDLRLRPKIITNKLIGNTEKQAKKIIKEIIKNKYKNYNLLIFGGETALNIPEKHGQGGRNTHFAAISLREFKKIKNITLACLSSDGSDYTKKSAGVIIDGKSFQRLKKKKINLENYIKNYNSFSLFKKISKSIIQTGPTDVNVGDIIVYLTK